MRVLASIFQCQVAENPIKWTCTEKGTVSAHHFISGRLQPVGEAVLGGLASPPLSALASHAGLML